MTTTHTDWHDDAADMLQADHVDITWTARDDRGRVVFASDASITSEQAAGMFRGIAAVDDENDFVVVRGGVVNNNPANPVFDLDILDTNVEPGHAAAFVAELWDLHERITTHPHAARALSPELDEIRDQIARHGDDKDRQRLAEQHEKGTTA